HSRPPAQDRQLLPPTLLAEPVVVRGDRHLLADVLGNLLDNALKFGGAGARVRLSTRMAGANALLAVQDDGPGIPVAELERIGTRFHRLHSDAPGHGLGLASVRAIIALHGGTIRFEQAHPGLRVQIELPALVAGAPPV
ncbi:MAG: ATP-binding protein, partial [Burkholderiales bacterium]